MRIDLPLKETWGAVSAEYRALLPGLSASAQVQVYAGYQHALFEATVGIAKVFSHKRSIALVEPTEPAAAAIEMAFAGEAYHIRHLRDLPGLGSAAEAKEQPLILDASDLAFVVFSDDDPVTGRIFDHSRLLDELKNQRIFRIHVSHASHRFGGGVVQPAPFEVRILSLSPERALLIAGERFRVEPALAPRLPWHTSVGAAERLAVMNPERYQAQRKLILDFEDSLPEGFQPYFRSDDQQRLFDRAVIFNHRIDGFAVIEELARVLGINLRELPGCDDLLETASPCRWNDPRMTDWLIGRGELEATVRGLVVIEPSLITEALPKALSQVAQKLEALQS